MRTICFPLTHRGAVGTAYRFQCNARIGAYIKGAREAKGITQKHLAQMLDGGVASASLSQWETGIRALPPQRFEAVMKVLELPREEFARVLLRNTNPHLFLLTYPDAPEAGEVRFEIGDLPGREFAPTPHPTPTPPKKGKR